MSTLKTSILLLCVIGLAVAERSPVFLWGVNSVTKPALKPLSKSDFLEVVTPILEHKALVVFLERGLTNKDFLCTDSATAQSCFARLRGVDEKNFYVGVENPMEALRSVGGEREFNSVDSLGKLQNPIKVAAGKVIIITFDDDDELAGRAAILKSHDAAIAEISKELGGDVAFMYTAAPSTAKTDVVWKRQKRSTAASSNGYIFRKGAEFLLYFTKLSIRNAAVVTVLDIKSMDVRNVNATVFSVSLAAANGKAVTFDIINSGGYYHMTNVMYDNVKFRSRNIYAPNDFSYFCGNLTLAGTGTDEESSAHMLAWNSLQFQAPFGFTKDPNFVFGDPWHCVGFFTGGILSGLFVVVLLLAITFTGICWMMDMKTMDRFDDPKGKTITVNVTE